MHPISSIEEGIKVFLIFGIQFTPEILLETPGYFPTTFAQFFIIYPACFGDSRGKNKSTFSKGYLQILISHWRHSSVKPDLSKGVHIAFLDRKSVV